MHWIQKLLYATGVGIAGVVGFFIIYRTFAFAFFSNISGGIFPGTDEANRHIPNVGLPLAALISGALPIWVLRTGCFRGILASFGGNLIGFSVFVLEIFAFGPLVDRGLFRDITQFMLISLTVAIMCIMVFACIKNERCGNIWHLVLSTGGVSFVCIILVVLMGESIIPGLLAWFFIPAAASLLQNRSSNQ